MISTIVKKKRPIIIIITAVAFAFLTQVAKKKDKQAINSIGYIN